MRKLRAGSLQMVTFMIVVIALLLSSFLILMHVHKQFRIKTSHIIETVQLADEGIAYSLTETITHGDSIEIELHDIDYKSLKIQRSFWGIFEKIHSFSKIKNNRFHKMALIGQNKVEKALILKDNGNPLVVIGDTRINGDSYLPKRGVKSGSINGHSFYGDTYVNGRIKTSHGFPKLNTDLLTNLETMFEASFEDQIPVKFLDLNRVKTISNSFDNPLLLAHSTEKIVLSENELKGHIIIRSNVSIIVDETSRLSDVILIAPVIKIKRNVRGSFQVFATESIEVLENVLLDYPSALVLYNNTNLQIKKEHLLNIRQNSTIRGAVLCLGETAEKNYKVQLKIENHALIEGEVFCEQNLELRGTVHGSVYTHNFIVKEGGTTYQNHLFNGQIDVHELLPEYVGLAFHESPRKVIKWLY